MTDARPALQPLAYDPGARRRLVRSAALLTVGVYLLTGCIPIPATGLYQPNGKRTPDAKVGRSSDAPVSLGRTPIEDALKILIEQRSDSKTPRSTGLFADAYYERGWRVSSDGRHFRVAYSVRTGWVIWPLCFYSEAQQDYRELQLDTDARGIVTAGYVVSQAERRSRDFESPLLYANREAAIPYETVVRSLTPELKARFQSAGLLLSDDKADKILRVLRAAATQRTTVTRPALSRPATSQAGRP